MQVSVLRLGHRKQRDKRVTTHVGLVARAFGADEIIITGDKDKDIIDNLEKVTERWGGPFKVKYEKNWKNVIKNWKGKIVHLTFYGLPVRKKINEIRKFNKVLVIVGGQKVDKEVYQIADYNISITNQPHSEISALSIFLYEFFKGKDKKFKNAKLEIIPSSRDKKFI